MLGPFATASRYIAIHQVSLLSHAATVARRLCIDVHNDDDNDNNDNAWQGTTMAPWNGVSYYTKLVGLKIFLHYTNQYISLDIYR